MGLGTRVITGPGSVICVETGIFQRVSVSGSANCPKPSNFWMIFGKLRNVNPLRSGNQVVFCEIAERKTAKKCKKQVKRTME